MTKVIHCRDVGFECDAVVRAETEDAALAQAALHARAVHGMDDIPAEVVAKVRSVMRDEPGPH